MMLKRSSTFLVIIVTGLIQPLLAQQQIIKAYADTTSERYYCFYPSTLRMLNLSKSEDYNKMVKDIEKLMVFKLDTTATEEKTYLIMLQDYKANGFDEYAVMTGGKTNFQIFGKEEKTNEFVGVIKSEKDLYIFYMLGMIDFIKIPSLIQSIQSGDMLNIFTLNSR